jgi:hypothetical protein
MDLSFSCLVPFCIPDSHVQPMQLLTKKNYGRSQVYKFCGDIFLQTEGLLEEILNLFPNILTKN